MERDELFDDRQAEAGAAVAARGAAVPLAEALEDGGAELRRHAGSAVVHGDLRFRVAGDQPERDGAAVGRELEGVREQVEQHALELVGIGGERRRRRRLDHEAHLALVRQGLEVRRHAAHQPRGIELGELGLHVAGVQP